MDPLGRLLQGTLSLDDLVKNRSEEEIQAEMRRLRARRYALPDGEHLFPATLPDVAEFNALVENKAFGYYMTLIWQAIYDAKMNLGFGGDIRENILVEGLAMSISIFDRMEREIFSEDTSQPEEPSPQEGES